MNPSLDQSNIELRKFTKPDIDSLNKLLNDAGSHGHRDWPDKISDLRSMLEFPRVQPHKNLVLAHLKNNVIGYAIVEIEKNIGRSVVGFTSNSSDSATLGKLLDWGTKRARYSTYSQMTNWCSANTENPATHCSASISVRNIFLH